MTASATERMSPTLAGFTPLPTATGREVPAAMVRELSLERARAVKDAIVEQFKFDDGRFAVDGLGWDRPADDDHPDNHALNRRVEIKVYAAEQE